MKFPIRDLLYHHYQLKIKFKCATIQIDATYNRRLLAMCMNNNGTLFCESALISGHAEYAH